MARSCEAEPSRATKFWRPAASEAAWPADIWILNCVKEALYLKEHFALHAGIDVSDGLSLDLYRMAQESGCGAVLDLTAIPISEDARRLAEHSDLRTPLDHALSDGEDFELLLAVPPEEVAKLLAEQPLDVRLSCIGEFIPQPGLWQREEDGPRRPLIPRGWEHIMD